MATLSSQTLLATPLLHIRDVQCSACRGRHVGAAECDPVSHIVIPHRGSFVRRVGSRLAHADVNQALFFNAAEEYRIDHLGEGGDACLSLDVSEDAMSELPHTSDLTAMALDLGFTSHSQFTTAFKRAYGIQPSACRRELLKNREARPAAAN